MDFFGIGPLELVLILIVILIFVGPAKLPEVAGFLGRTMRKFREASAEMNRSLKEISDEVQKVGKEASEAAKSEAAVVKDLKNVSRELQETVNEAKTTTKSAEGLSKDLKEASKEVSEAVRETTDPDVKPGKAVKKTRGSSPKTE